MKYFKDPDGQVHGFDDADQGQVTLMESLAVGWLDITGNWPPAQTLQQLQVEQVTDIQFACKAVIEAGFPSSALGSAYIYPSTPTDQNNLLSAVTATTGSALGGQTQLWCASGGVWAFTEHTAAQVQQVNTDWVAFRTKLQAQYAALVAKINAATTATAVQAITWSMP